jgi:hypothetical protein
LNVKSDERYNQHGLFKWIYYLGPFTGERYKRGNYVTYEYSYNDVLLYYSYDLGIIDFNGLMQPWHPDVPTWNLPEVQSTSTTRSQDIATPAWCYTTWVRQATMLYVQSGPSTKAACMFVFGHATHNSKSYGWTSINLNDAEQQCHDNKWNFENSAEMNNAKMVAVGM